MSEKPDNPKRDKPFTDLLKKTKDPEFSRRLYGEVLNVFTRHGLNEEQTRALLWGSLEDIEEEVAKEFPHDRLEAFSYGPPRPFPMHPPGVQPERPK